MPWKLSSAMSERKTFCALATAAERNMSELCRRYGISRPTGYKWARRGADAGDAGRYLDLSRRPQHSPRRTATSLEDEVVAIRRAHPAWGGRTIAQVLRNKGISGVPTHSTITNILHRHGLIHPEESVKHRPWQRFEHAEPNDLWQMDFKGHFPLADAVTRCHPLTILDDHSRFSLTIRACGHETDAVVRQALTDVFRRYGLPRCVLTDNGSPWGAAGEDAFTALNVWLMRLGILVSHCRPYHPQTQGKDERFHRTLKAEVLHERIYRSFSECQQAFDAWREVYNCERPHQGINMQTPASRYAISPRTFPETLHPIEYGPEDIVRKVQSVGEISYRGRHIIVGRAFRGQPVALRPTADDGVYDIIYCNQTIDTINLTTSSEKV